MSHAPLLNDHVLNIVPEDLSNCVILDVACGLGEWGFLIRTRKSGCPYLIGVDIWRPYLEKVGSLRIYDDIIQVPVSHIPLKEKSVDLSLACEILEHLPSKMGHKLLKELERITKRIIIVSTPLNYPQEDARDNPYERHVGEWTPEIFLRLGFQTKIVYELPKALRLVDTVRRLAFRAPPLPRFILACKYQSEHDPPLTQNRELFIHCSTSKTT